MSFKKEQTKRKRWGQIKASCPDIEEKTKKMNADKINSKPDQSLEPRLLRKEKEEEQREIRRRKRWHRSKHLVPTLKKREREINR
ncbi:MAG: hypothetical protein ACMUHM_08380 [Thermoplasmatota archaeon]